ncbi:MAG: hypothetical protein FWF81_04595, partial [Defluviitaleaceae bacterium]|nr:hypothetical protein [Defluviitaleaceae bacterium]
GVMIHSKDSEYALANPTEKQKKLINGIADYAAKWARSEGFDDIAKEIDKEVGISKGIKDVIDPSPVKSKSRGYERD